MRGVAWIALAKPLRSSFVAREDIAYKTYDRLFRSRDEYAQGKYDVTTRWLAPSIQRADPERLLVNVGCGSGEYNAVARARGFACSRANRKPKRLRSRRGPQHTAATWSGAGSWI